MNVLRIGKLRSGGGAYLRLLLGLDLRDLLLLGLSFRELLLFHLRPRRNICTRPLRSQAYPLGL